MKLASGCTQYSRIKNGYEAAGVDLLIMMMQTESVPHEKVMKSIELVGREVMPRFGKRAKAEKV